MATPTTLGSAIKAGRKQLELTLGELSRKTNYSIGYLSRLELDKVSNPSPACLMSVAVALKLDPVELLRLKEERGQGSDLRSHPVPPSEEESAIGADALHPLGTDSPSKPYPPFLQVLTDSSTLRPGIGSTILAQNEVTREPLPRPLPGHLADQYEHLASGHLSMGEALCRQGDVEEKPLPFYRKALELYHQAEKMLSALEPSPTRDPFIALSHYRKARIYERLARLQSEYSKTAEVSNFTLCSDSCEAARSSLSIQDQHSDLARALLPAILSASGYCQDKLSREIALELGYLEKEGSPEKGEDRKLLRSKKEALEVGVILARSEAERLLEDWVHQLKSRQRGQERDDLLAQAIYRLAILYRGIEATRELRGEEADLNRSEQNFIQSLEIRRDLARNETGKGKHRWLLARYHVDFGVTLTYAKHRPGRYQAALWQLKVAGHIHPAFQTPVNFRLSELVSTLEPSDAQSEVVSNRRVMEELGEADFDLLRYPISIS